jgi:acyl-CoA thioester hydrolase
VIVRAELVEWENRLKIHYLITDAASGTRLTRASSVQVAVCMDKREMQLVSPACLLDAVRKVLA